MSGEHNQATFLPNPKGFEIAFQLVANQSGELPTFIGEPERAILLKLLNSYYPDIANELHEYNIIRPYAITPLSFLTRFPNFKFKTFNIKEGYRYKFKISFITSRHFEKTLEAALNYDKSKFQIKGIEFLLESMKIVNKTILTLSDPEDTLKTSGNTPNAWNIWFKTPTQFKTKFNTMLYFPHPNYIFNSLFRVWKEFIPVPKFVLNEDWDDFLNKQCYCRAHDISTVQVKFGKTMEVGFIGWAQIICKVKNHPLLPFLTALLELGETMNVGSKRTIGFGVMNYKIKST